MVINKDDNWFRMMTVNGSESIYNKRLTMVINSLSSSIQCILSVIH